MKNLLLALALAVGLSGCAGLPEPRETPDALIVGKLALEFPDGFLGQPARTVRSNLLLYFKNLSTGKSFCGLTSDGYFYFRGSGGDRYVLQRYEYSYRDQYDEFYLNDEIALEFRSAPGKRVYLGDLSIRYEKPRTTNRVTFARSTSFEDAGISLASEDERFPMVRRIHPTYWRYQRAEERRWDDEALTAFLTEKDPASPWLEREIAR